MVEFFQQYGSYISAIVVIIFQIIKAIINNRKMNNKFDAVSGFKKVNKKSDKEITNICDAIKSAEAFKKELTDKIDALKSELSKKSVIVEDRGIKND